MKHVQKIVQENAMYTTESETDRAPGSRQPGKRRRWPGPEFLWTPALQQGEHQE